MRIPSTRGSRFKRCTRSNSSPCEVVAGKSCANDSISASREDLRLFRTYTVEAGSCPTCTTASPGRRPCLLANSRARTATSPRTLAATALPSITIAVTKLPQNDGFVSVAEHSALRMPLDGAILEITTRLGGEDLHVAGEHHELRVGTLKQLEHPLFLLGLAAIDDRQIMIRHAVPLGEAAHVLVIGHDRHHFDGQRPRAPPVQDTVEAVTMPRDGEQHAALALHFVEAP